MTTTIGNLTERNGDKALLMQGASLDFGGGAGVFDLTFSLPRGAILGMIGPSGCGKTTTIRLLNGIYGPTAGDVRVFDKHPLEFGGADKARIGYIPQQFILYPTLSADENLHFLGGIYGMSVQERRKKIHDLLDFVELTAARKRLGRQLSGGMQRRLMLAGALLHDPDLLFADEPTAGIDPFLRSRIWENFRDLRNQGKTLLVTTQYVGEAAFISSNFYLAKVTADRDEALAILDRGEADAVQIIPAFSGVSPENTKRPEIEIYSRTIDPTAEAWIRSLAYGEMNFVNQMVLTQEANLAQAKAREVAAYLESASGQFRLFQLGLGMQDLSAKVDAAKDLRNVLTAFLGLLPALSDAQANLAPELYQVHLDVQILLDELDELIDVFQNGTLSSQVERLSSTLEEVETLRGAIAQFAAIPPETVISPVQETYTNLRGARFSMVIFYTPAVLALLIQQLAVTLGALGLVREQQMGSFEMFRVSPLRFSHILFGKSVAYILYVTVAGAVLTALLALLHVPMPAAHPVQFAALLIMLATSSAGVGFLISAVSGTDSQAIQLTMLLLLLSIFFSGFFLPMSGFMWPAWLISALLPMTHAIEGFQELLLKGESVDFSVWLWLALITLLAYGLVGLIMRRRYARIVR